MPRRDDTFGRVIRDTIAAKGWTLRDVAERADVAHTTVLNWSKGEIPSSPDYVRQMADALEIPRQTLLSIAEFLPTAEDLEFDRSHFSVTDPILSLFTPLGRAVWDREPLVGGIHATGPHDGGDRTPEYPEGIIRLRVQGDCMAPTINPGDTVRLRVTQAAEHEDIVAVSVGEEMFLRKYLRQNGTVILRARNPAHADFTLPAGTDGYRIEGVVIGIEKSVKETERNTGGDGGEG